MKPHIKRLLDLTERIQQIPAPTFGEAKRACFARQLFETEGLTDISMDSVENVYARLPGTGDLKPLLISAHLDTVFPIETDLNISHNKSQIFGPGIGDNSLGVATLFGIMWLLKERNITLPGDIWLVANTCEEGLGNLRGMRSVVDRFGADVYAYLILEGLSLGYIQHRALGVQRYRIRVNTKGGHSWSDYGQPSAIHEMSSLITKLTAIPLAQEPRTTMNIGRVAGGTAINAIAEDAWLELDLRSENPQALDDLVHTIEHLIETFDRPGIKVDAGMIGQRPAGELSTKHPLVQIAKECLKEQGIKPKLMIGSTDANVPLSRKLPAIVLGVTYGGGAHTTREFIHTEPVAQGLEQLVSFVGKVWG